MLNLYWKLTIPGKQKPKVEYLLGCEAVARMYSEKKGGDLMEVTEQEADADSDGKIKYLGDL